MDGTGTYDAWMNMPVTVVIDHASTRSKTYFSFEKQQFFQKWTHLDGKKGKLLNGSPQELDDGNVGPWRVNIKFEDGGIEEVPLPILVHEPTLLKSNIKVQKIMWIDPNGNCALPLALNKKKLSLKTKPLNKTGQKGPKLHDIPQCDGTVEFPSSESDSDSIGGRPHVDVGGDIVFNADDGADGDVEDDATDENDNNNENDNFFYNAWGLNENVC